MITDLKGGARLVGQAKPAQLGLLAYLPPGEEIELDDGAQLAVTYFDESSEFSFKGPARILIQQKIAKVVKGAQASVRHLDAEKSAGAGKFARTGKLVFAAAEMRSIAIKPKLLSPVNTRIGTTTPSFSWKSVNEVESYLVMLIDENGQTIQQASVPTTSWQLPAGFALKAGATYQWSVTETLKSDEKLTSKGKFSVADEETVARVFAKHPGAEASFSEKVTYAIFLESEEFREDAKTLWRELSNQRPDDANLKFRAR